VFGFGAGIFFAGYFFFEVPSNIMLERLGARTWIARIVMTWGIIACCLTLVRDAYSFYAVRFLLGVAEAGFFPGILLYLTYWFPNNLRGRAAARFILAGVVAGIIGNPIGAALLNMNGLGGLHGWQWLFLIEGIPSFLLGFVVLAYLTDRPEKAHWLAAEERDWLVSRLGSERTHRERHHGMPLVQAFRYPRVLHLCLLFFLYIFGGAGPGLFTNPLLKQRLHMSDQATLLIATIPTIVGALSLLTFSSLSDRTGERRGFAVVGLLLAAAGFGLVASTTSPWWSLAGLCLVQLGTQCFTAPFWALTTGFLSGAAAAGGLAFINSVGNSGSFFGPWLTGWLNDITHNYRSGFLVGAGIWAAAALVAYLLPDDPAVKSAREAEGQATSA
jgi:ACS family tartrate transporter-like MFS transporter